MSAAPFTPRAQAYDLLGGEWLPFGKWRRYQREDCRKSRAILRETRLRRRVRW